MTKCIRQQQQQIKNKRTPKNKTLITLCLGPPKTECGCIHGGVIENGRARNTLTLWTVPVLIHVRVWVHTLVDCRRVQLRNATTLVSLQKVMNSSETEWGCLLGGVYVLCIYRIARCSYRRRLGSLLLCACSMCATSIVRAQLGYFPLFVHSNSSLDLLIFDWLIDWLISRWMVWSICDWLTTCWLACFCLIGWLVDFCCCQSRLPL